MEEYQDYTQEIDLMEVFSALWSRRRFIIIATACFIVLGLFAALGTVHHYRTNIAFVPQSNSTMNSKISSLASMAGLSLDDSQSDGVLSPIIYPRIIDNKEFLRDLSHTKIDFRGYDAPIELVDWFTDEQYLKKNFFVSLRKYTLGLPGVIKDAVTPEKHQETVGDDMATHIVTLTDNEAMAIKSIRRALNLEVLKNERHLVLSAVMDESLASAELADAAYELVKKYISSFKVQKSQQNLDFLEEQYAAAKAEYEAKQSAYAYCKDRNLGSRTAASEVALERMKTECDLAKALYMELAKNCLTARVKVSENTVSFTEIIPPSIPDKSTNSRKSVLIIWTLIGFVLSCAYVLVEKWIKDKKKEQTDN